MGEMWQSAMLVFLLPSPSPRERRDETGRVRRTNVLRMYAYTHGHASTHVVHIQTHTRSPNEIEKKHWGKKVLPGRFGPRLPVFLVFSSYVRPCRTVSSSPAVLSTHRPVPETPPAVATAAAEQRGPVPSRYGAHARPRPAPRDRREKAGGAR